MKATELMIGDWVSQSNGNPVRLEWVKTGEYGYYDKNGIPQIACTPLLKPIPLTTEILKKNGWEIVNLPALEGNPIAKIKLVRGDVEYQIQCRIKHYFRVIGFWLKEITDPNEVPYFFVPTTIIIHRNWNIHELQHALRLCGFDELADNFKV